MKWPREKLAAWGAATGLHVLGLALLASAGFAPRVSDVPLPDAPAPVIVEIVELIVPESAPEPVVPEPVTPELEPEAPAPPDPVPQKPDAPITAIVQSRTEDARLAPPPSAPASPQPAPGPRMSVPSDQKLSSGPPYPETPPPPLQRALRAIGCARFSPSQRVNCPTDEMEDEFISALAAEARGAQPVYDPVWDVYQAQTLLDRMANSPGGPGMFSRSENAAPVMSNGLGGTAASGVSTMLNAKPDPVFDGGRYQSWDENAGAPG